jgi:hypothetical protein
VNVGYATVHESRDLALHRREGRVEWAGSVVIAEAAVPLERWSLDMGGETVDNAYRLPVS